jgi:hypothetical protein
MNVDCVTIADAYNLLCLLIIFYIDGIKQNSLEMVYVNQEKGTPRVSRPRSLQLMV